MADLGRTVFSIRLAGRYSPRRLMPEKAQSARDATSRSEDKVTLPESFGEARMLSVLITLLRTEGIGDTMEEFGPFLRDLRSKANLGLRRFADLIDIKPSNLSDIENGRRHPPADPEKLREIAQALGLAEDSDEWRRLFDAARRRGDLPADIRHMADRKLVPALLRTIDNLQLGDDEISRLITDIEAHPRTWAGAVGTPSRAALGHERRHAHPLGHRAGRPAGGRGSAAAGLRRAAQAGRAEAGAGEARADAPGHGPGPRGLPAAGRTRSEARHWNSRGHFFAAAAEAMRRILVDNARRKRRPKHGGDRQRVELDDVDLAGRRTASDDLLALDEALTRLAARGPAKAELVKLRYFAGPVDRGGGRVPRHLAARPPSGTGPTPGPGCSAELRRRRRRDP